MEPDKKNPFYKEWWFWVIIVVALAIFRLNSQKQTSTTPTEEGSEQPATQVNNQATGKTQPASSGSGQYVEIMSFNGNGQKQSEPFTITGSRFKIAYECRAGANITYCGAYLYNIENNMPQVVVNVQKATKDETIIYGSGEYYLKTNTITSDLLMTVYDYK